MRTVRRLLACSLLAVLCIVGTGTSPASAAPAQMVDEIWEPANPYNAIGHRHCMTRNVVLAAGNYLWEGHRQLYNARASTSRIGRVQKIIYLRAGTYRWSTCVGVTTLGCTSPGGTGGCSVWRHSNSLTELATGGVARNHGYINNWEGYTNITRYGANLWRCSTERVC